MAWTTKEDRIMWAKGEKRNLSSECKPWSRISVIVIKNITEQLMKYEHVSRLDNSIVLMLIS